MAKESKNEDVEAAQPQGVGEQLKSARDEQGMSLNDISESTRIPLRHLEVIEAGNWSDLPGRTYALGFTRSYAKAVGLDQAEIAREVRHEMGLSMDDGSAVAASTFEPGDPAKVSSRKLAWYSVFAFVILAVGSLAFFSDFFVPGSGPPSLLSSSSDKDADDGAGNAGGKKPAPASGGAVVFTALEDGVWVRFSDAAGERLLEKTMVKGETFTVPEGAIGPELNTGRPDALSITIGGKAVPKLAEEPQTMGKAPVSAKALLARNSDGAGATP